MKLEFHPLTVSDLDNAVSYYDRKNNGWEISIKRGLGKLKAPEYLNELVEKAGFEHLSVTFLHREIASSLPLYHRDPFDRMLIAQAQVEDLTLISSDEEISKYKIKLINI